MSHVRSDQEVLIRIGAGPRIRRSWVTAGLALGTVAYLGVVVLGLVTPFDGPTRDRVDDSLLLLGVSGLLNAALVARFRMVVGSTVGRVLLVAFGLLAGAALGLADFGAHRAVGWGVKAAGALVLAVALSGAARS